MSVYIYPLRDFPHLSSIVIKWLYEKWGNNNPSYWKSWIESSMKLDNVPITYIALEADILIGTISIWRCDLQARQDLFPWVGGLYIDPKYRGRQYENKKLGVVLQEFCIDQLKSFGYKEAFLYAEPSLVEYYRKFGWEKIGESYDEKDNLVYVFRYQITYEMLKGR